jgi:predicted  nucleic acid-binding Zn-ribbon protein
MSRVSQLYEMQQIDSGLDSRIARLRQIDEQMADSPELVAARSLYDETRSIFTARQTSLKHLSHDAEDTSTRLKTQEKRLYDGAIKNPKELSQVQEEVSHLKGRLRALEDGVLDAMMAAEEAEAVVATRKEELERVEKNWEQYKAGLLEEKDKLVEQSKVLQVKRQRAIAELPWADLQMYERLRRSKGGIAVATVQGGQCAGCHVGVPAHVLRTARSSSEFTPCPTCGRILYPTEEVKFKEFDHDLDNINR